MMNSLVNDYPGVLLSAHEPPCITLYLPTHRHYPQSLQNPARFLNLLKTLEEPPRNKYLMYDLQPLLRSFHELAGDTAFWSHPLDGVAVLCSPGFFRVYRLQRAVPEMVSVSDAFHLIPLMHIMQRTDRYQVLSLNLKEIRMFEGNRHAIDEIPLAKGVPGTVTEALGEELAEPHITISFSSMGATGSMMRHGYGEKKDDAEKDEERYFRIVDKAVLDHHSRPSGLPLLLAALPEHQSFFRKISKNPFLVPDGIPVHPDSLSRGALCERAWKIMEPRFLGRLRKIAEDYGDAKAKGHASDEPARIADAAMAGRVAVLLIESDRRPTRGMEPRFPEMAGTLDEVNEMVVRKGGQILLVPSDLMPVKTGIAAIYRY